MLASSYGKFRGSVRCAVVLLLALLPIGSSEDTECPTLCADGSEPTESDNTIAVDNGDGTGVTCGQLKNLIVSPDFETSSCQLLQATAFAHCGCPTLPPTTCEICPGGGLPDPSLEDVDEAGDTVVCADFIVGAALQSDSDLCPNIEEALAQFCGCPAAGSGETSEQSPTPQETDGPTVAPSLEEGNVTEVPEACPSLCADGTEIDPDAVESFPGQRDCEGLLLLVESVDPDRCQTLQVVGWAECGCPTLPADLECPLCSDGSEPLAPDLVYGSDAGGGDLTCGSAQERVASNPNRCRAIRNAAEEICCFPTDEPTRVPATASMPTHAPSPAVTSVPSEMPSMELSEMPSLMVSEVPSFLPSPIPSITTDEPSGLPSEIFLSEMPSEVSMIVDTTSPSFDPTNTLMDMPTNMPTNKPTNMQTNMPTTNMPTNLPTDTDTDMPTNMPSSTLTGTSEPTVNPSSLLSPPPSSQPVVQPTRAPSAPGNADRSITSSGPSRRNVGFGSFVGVLLAGAILAV